MEWPLVLTTNIRWLFRAIFAIFIGILVGVIVEFLLAILLDVMWQDNVTGGRWPLNIPNVIVVVSSSFVVGYTTGWIAGKRGKLLAGIAIFAPIIFTITISLIKNVDLFFYFRQQFDTEPALWAWIGLIPAVIGGHFGALNAQKHILPDKGNRMNALGSFIKVTGWVIWVISGFWGFILCLAIISKAAGFWGLLAAFTLLPITFIAAPLYSGFAWGDWFPLVLNYGGTMLGLALVATGSALSGKW